MDQSHILWISNNRIPNDEQTDCITCPNNVVANVVIGKCRCPGDLVFEDEDWDNCEYLHIFIQIDLLWNSAFVLLFSKTTAVIQHFKNHFSSWFLQHMGLPSSKRNENRQTLKW